MAPAAVARGAPQGHDHHLHLRPRRPSSSAQSSAVAPPVCVFWLQGRCARRPCRFLHPQDSPPPPPPPPPVTARSKVWRNPRTAAVCAAPPPPAAAVPGGGGSDDGAKIKKGTILAGGNAVDGNQRLYCCAGVEPRPEPVLTFLSAAIGAFSIPPPPRGLDGGDGAKITFLPRLDGGDDVKIISSPAGSGDDGNGSEHNSKILAIGDASDGSGLSRPPNTTPGPHGLDGGDDANIMFLPCLDGGDEVLKIISSPAGGGDDGDGSEHNSKILAIGDASDGSGLSRPPTTPPPPRGLDGGNEVKICAPPAGEDHNGNEHNGKILTNGDASDNSIKRSKPALPCLDICNILPCLDGGDEVKTSSPPTSGGKGHGGSEKNGTILSNGYVSNDSGLSPPPTPAPGTGCSCCFFLLGTLDCRGGGGGSWNPVMGIALPSGFDKLFSVCRDGTIRIWDASNGQCVQVSSLGVPAACLITEGPWVFAGARGGVNCCHVQTGAGLALPEPHGQVLSLAASDDMLFAGVKGGGAILVWKMTTTTSDGSWSISPATTMLGHTAAVVSLVVGRGRLYSGSRDCTIRAWDLETLCCLYVVSGHTGAVSSLLCWDVVLLSGSLDGTIRVWATAPEESGDGLEEIFQLRVEHRVLVLNGMEDSEGSSVLMCSLDDRSVRLYDLPSFSLRGEIRSRRAVRAIHTGPHGLFFTGDTAGGLRVWRWSSPGGPEL